MMCVFFCFKQKTAYEMRISDWSSDVCSSDLSGGGSAVPVGAASAASFSLGSCKCSRLKPLLQGRAPDRWRQDVVFRRRPERVRSRRAWQNPGASRYPRGTSTRPEEHTSEIQSPLRSSYAVFCLQKKQTYTNP